MRYADLHLHTHHSDGTRTPREVIDLAEASGLQIIAISDHDNVAAFFEIEGYARDRRILLIPAIELSCGWEGVDVHILAYAFDPHDERIAARLESFRETRLHRGRAMVERLCALGYEIDVARVEALAAGGAMGRPHVARALVEAGHAATVSDAFDTLIGAGKPAYVEKARFDVAEAVRLIHDAGGLTSVAHPVVYPNHQVIVPRVLEAGVDGVEVFHPDVGEADRMHYTELAKQRNKMITGGSDDHGTVKTCETIGTIRVPEDVIGPILERVEN